MADVREKIAKTIEDDMADVRQKIAKKIEDDKTGNFDVIKSLKDWRREMPLGSSSKNNSSQLSALDLAANKAKNMATYKKFEGFVEESIDKTVFSISYDMIELGFTGKVSRCE